MSSDSKPLPRKHLAGRLTSPRCERARFSLDHHGLVYEVTNIRSMLQEPWLRVFARTPAGPLELPILRDGSQVVAGSFEVAQHAEREGTRARLFQDITVMARWNTWSDRAIAAGDALAKRALSKSDAGLDESWPLPLPRAVKGVARPLARHFVERRIGVDGTRADVADAHELTLRTVLTELSRGLEAGGGSYLSGGRFSYADVAMAAALQVVKPVSHPSVPMSLALVACFTRNELADEFAPLLAWRDRIYQEHRRTPASA